MMAYKIEYSPESARRYPQMQKDKRLKPTKLLILMFAIIAALWMRLNGVPDLLIPGDATVTRAAASDFMNCVQAGVPIGEAVTAFCQTILDGAEF